MCKKFWNIASETLMQNVLLYLIILVKIIPNYFIFFFFCDGDDLHSIKNVFTDLWIIKYY